MSEDSYSRLSPWAVLSAITGSLAALGLLIPEFALLAVVAVAAGVWARFTMRKYELSGGRLAAAGVAISIVFAAFTPFWHWVQFNAESLDKHRFGDRIKLIVRRDNETVEIPATLQGLATDGGR